ncbi:MAG TPA: TMEM175 family protein, partial [Cyclobacteriaceae bacterium]|nr:TMEM175 family protein [Cyclobacteriaceae bacterium]
MNHSTGHFSKTRVEAFSDGIFAIIVTLLVLEIKVP